MTPKREWVLCCARRLKKTGGYNWPDALNAAAWLANEQESKYGKTWESPEDVADSELAR